MPPVVVNANACGPSSGAAERCVMHLKRLQSASSQDSSSSHNHILVQHDDAHAIIVLHVDSASCTPVVGGGIALDSLHCTAQVRNSTLQTHLHIFHSCSIFSRIFNDLLLSICFFRFCIDRHCTKLHAASRISLWLLSACCRVCWLTALMLRETT
jgi:hypothetical protein